MINVVQKDNCVNFKFSSKGDKQKILIDALLKYSLSDINTLACMLDVPLSELQEVYQGNDIFLDSKADNLALLFLIFFSD